MPSEKTRKHWKIYRGNLRSPHHGTVVCWATSEENIKKVMRDLRSSDPENYDGAGDYHAVYIGPTKRDVVDWLQRNFTTDNG